MTMQPDGLSQIPEKFTQELQKYSRSDLGRILLAIPHLNIQPQLTAGEMRSYSQGLHVFTEINGEARLSNSFGYVGLVSEMGKITIDNKSTLAVGSNSGFIDVHGGNSTGRILENYGALRAGLRSRLFVLLNEGIVTIEDQSSAHIQTHEGDLTIGDGSVYVDQIEGRGTINKYNSVSDSILFINSSDANKIDTTKIKTFLLGPHIKSVFDQYAKGRGPSHPIDERDGTDREHSRIIVDSLDNHTYAMICVAEAHGDLKEKQLGIGIFEVKDPLSLYENCFEFIEGNVADDPALNMHLLKKLGYDHIYNSVSYGRARDFFNQKFARLRDY